MNKKCLVVVLSLLIIIIGQFLYFKLYLIPDYEKKYSKISLDYFQVLSEMKAAEKEKSSFEYLSKLYTSYLKEYDYAMKRLLDDYSINTTGMEEKYVNEIEYVQANIDYSNEKIVKIEYYNMGANNGKIFSVFTINTACNYLEYNDSDIGKIPNTIYFQHIVKIIDSNGELHVEKIQ